jgi:hypothetical protein
VWETGQGHRGFCSVNVRDRTIHPRWKDNVKMDLNEIEIESVLTGVVWLRTGMGGELLKMRYQLFKLHTIRVFY